MPRGVDENCTQLCLQKFNLHANQNVSFPLFSSATRVDDQVGDLLTNADELTPVAELVTTINLGKNQSQTITARLESEINEVGVLQVSLHAEKTDHRGPLKFDIRSQQSGSEVTITVEEDLLQKATGFIQAAFTLISRANKTQGFPGKAAAQSNQIEFSLRFRLTQNFEHPRSKFKIQF